MHKEYNVEGISFAAYALQTFSALIISLISNLAVSIVTARILGPEGKGALAILNLYPTVLLTISSLSIYRSLTIHIAEKRFPLAYFPGSISVYILIVSVVMVLVSICTYFFMPGLFIHNVPFSLVLLSLAMFPSLLVNQLFSNMLQACGKVSQYNLKDIFNNICLIVFVFIALIMLKRGIGGALFSFFAANALTACFAIYLVRTIAPERWKYSFSLLKDLIKDGAKLHIAVIATLISSRINILMLGFYRQTSSAGYYSVALSIAELICLVSVAIHTVFYSRFSEMVRDKAEMARKTVRIYKHSIAVFAVFTILLCLFSRKIIILFYGLGFLPSLKPLLILLPGAALFYLNNVLVVYLVATKKFFHISIIYSICSFLNVWLNIVLIPRYDVIGAAAATSVSYLAQAVLIFIIFLSVSKYTIKEFFKELLFKREDIFFYQALIGEAIAKLKNNR